jgi:hypothetical protein
MFIHIEESIQVVQSESRFSPLIQAGDFTHEAGGQISHTSVALVVSIVDRYDMILRPCFNKKTLGKNWPDSKFLFIVAGPEGLIFLNIVLKQGRRILSYLSTIVSNSFGCHLGTHLSGGECSTI